MNENTDFAAEAGTGYFKNLKERLEALARSVEYDSARYEEAIAAGDFTVAANMLGRARSDYRLTMFEAEADIALQTLHRVAGIQSVTDHLKGSKK